MDDIVAPSPVSDPDQRKKWEDLPPPGRWPENPKEHQRGMAVMPGVRQGQEIEATSGSGFPGQGRSMVSADHGTVRTAWQGWGWGPSQSNHHRKVAGWDWDDHLEAYTANQPGRFACSCGNQMSMPGHHECHCGRLYNGYVIGTGGSNREAAAEKYLVRELMVRPDVIVANKQAAGDFEAEDDDWPEHHPKVKEHPHKTPSDWAHRGPKNEFSSHPLPRRHSPQTQPAQL